MDNEQPTIPNFLATFLRWSRFFGVSPLKFEKRENVYRVGYSPRISLISRILVTCINLCLLWSVFTGSKPEQVDVIKKIRKVMLFVTWKIEIILTIVSVTVSIYGAPRRMRILINSWKMLQNINTKLGIHVLTKIWSTTQHRLFMLIIIIMMIPNSVTICAIVYDTINVLTGFDVYNIILHQFVMGFYHWIVYIGTLQFSAVVLHIRTNFQNINSSLKNVLQEIKDSERNDILLGRHSLYSYKANKIYRKNENAEDPTGATSDDSTQPRYPYEEVRRLVLAYISTCDVVKSVDQSFGLVLLMNSIFFFYKILIKLFRVTDRIIESGILEDEQIYQQKYEYVVQILWIILDLIGVIILTEPCHNIKMEINLTRQLVSQLMHQTHSIYEPLSVELEQFYRFLSISDASYKPMKLFSLRRGLVILMLGNITTYLVILIQ